MYLLHKLIPTGILFFYISITLLLLGGCLQDRAMANQYSITVSEDTDRILNEMKKSGYKVSQVIDAAIKTLQQPALARAVALERRVKTLEGDE
jgi:hypothetical protein